MGQNPSPVNFTLQKESELRFEVEDHFRQLSLEVKSGFAEVFGAELVKKRKYEFGQGSKVAVFSWQGCSLELSYRPNVCYVSGETPMPFYLNCHLALENMREAAEAQGKRGPVALVAGPPDVGKSSLCQLLLNYAARRDRQPLYVDLDPDLGHVSVPGTVCALPIERPALVPEGFPRLLPLVLHYGHFSPASNAGHFNALVGSLAERSFSRIERNARHKSAGIVVDTCGARRDIVAYETLLHAAQAFEIDVVLVIDHEKLCNQLIKDLPDFVKVVPIPKSGGVVERSMGQRTVAREQSIRDYFYGRRAERLFPHSQEIKFDKLKLYATFPVVPASCVPAGLTVEHARKLFPVKPTAALLHCLLAVSYAETADESAPLANVMGFVCVADIDLERKLVTVLSPQSRSLPTNHLFFVSRVQFFDSD